MKNTLLAIFAFLSIMNLYSQSINITWGQGTKDDENGAISEFIYDDGTTLYSSYLGVDGSRLYPSIIKYDNKLSSVKRSEFNPKGKDDNHLRLNAPLNPYFFSASPNSFSNKRYVQYYSQYYTNEKEHYSVHTAPTVSPGVIYLTGERDIVYNGGYYLGDKFIFLTSQLDKKTNTRSLYAQKVTKDLAKEGDNIMIGDINGEKARDVAYYFASSEDKSKFLVYYEGAQPNIKPKEFSFKVFDKDLNKSYEKSIEFPYTFDRVEIEKSFITNNNDVFVIVKVYKEGKAGKEKMKGTTSEVPAYDFIIKQYSQDGKEHEYPVDLQNRFLLDLSATDDKSGNLNVVASYQNEFEKDINGYTYMKIDAKAATIAIQTDFHVTEDLSLKIRSIQNDPPRSKERGLSDNFQITDLKIMNDNSIVVVIEKNYNELFGSGTGSSTNTFHSDGILVLKFDKNGKSEWNKFIPKLQYYVEDAKFLYHATMVCKDKVYIFFNDDIRNEKFDFENSKTSPKKFNDDTKMNLMMAKIDKDGSMNITSAGNFESMGTAVHMVLSKQISNNRMAFCGYNTKTKMVKVGVAGFE